MPVDFFPATDCHPVWYPYKNKSSGKERTIEWPALYFDSHKASVRHSRTPLCADGDRNFRVQCLKESCNPPAPKKACVFYLGIHRWCSAEAEPLDYADFMEAWGANTQQLGEDDVLRNTLMLGIAEALHLPGKKPLCTLIEETFNGFARGGATEDEDLSDATSVTQGSKATKKSPKESAVGANNKPSHYQTPNANAQDEQPLESGSDVEPPSIVDAPHTPVNGSIASVNSAFSALPTDGDSTQEEDDEETVPPVDSETDGEVSKTGTVPPNHGIYRGMTWDKVMDCLAEFRGMTEYTDLLSGARSFVFPAQDGEPDLTYAPEELQDYVVERYGWSERVASPEVTRRSTNNATPQQSNTTSRRTSPRSSSSTRSAQEGLSNGDYWKACEKKGWKCVPDHQFNWVYVHPDFTHDQAEMGITMFASVDDVRQFRSKGFLKSTVQTKRQRGATTGGCATIPLQLRSTLHQITPPPKLEEVRHILKDTIGVKIQRSGRFSLEIKHMAHERPLQFESARGLQAFFLHFGIPNYDKLSKKSKQKIEHWALFAHIPSDIPAELLEKFCSPTSIDSSLRSWLLAFRFEVFGGKVYRPSAPATRKPNVHYFSDSDLKPLQQFVQRAPLFGCSASIPTSSEDTSGGVEVIEPITGHEQEYIFLRLWGLRSTAPLPSFTDKMRQQIVGRQTSGEVSLLLSLKDYEIDFGRILDGMKNNKPARKEIRKVTPMASSKEKGPWYYKEKPSSWNIMPLLKKIGWEKVGRVYVHESLGPDTECSLQEVRLYMCNNALDNVKKEDTGLSKNELRMLHHWAVSVYLEEFWDLLPSDEVAVLKENKAKTILTRLGFGSVDGKLCVPFSDRKRAERKLLPLKKMYTKLRGLKVWSSNSATPEEVVGVSRYSHLGVTKSEMASLLLTAVVEGKQIPTFGTPPKQPRKSAGTSRTFMKLQEISPSPTVAMKKKKRKLSSIGVVAKKTKKSSSDEVDGVLAFDESQFSSESDSPVISADADEDMDFRIPGSPSKRENHTSELPLFTQESPTRRVSMGSVSGWS